jgi:hydroxymethylpyrimidine pyrophosphatase-like HAD family hydrolase/fructoselysine-6-P-deglycase FrlB-like protein
MGKPYELELENLRQTYQWALRVPIGELCSFINASHGLPLVAVGSGGSFSAAHTAALLHQRTGIISKGVTPLEFVSFGESIQDTTVLILSAGGRNSDILSAFRFAATSEPRQLMAFCMRTQSPLANLCKDYRYTHFLDLDLPFGKDGFLAVNSLLAFVTILIRAYNDLLLENWVLPKDLPSISDIRQQFNDSSTQPLLDKNTWIILYGGWGLPAAVDFESKFTEAALCHVQIADYRNFAHGRHHWLAKRGRETGIVALITPAEKEMAQRTLNLLPQNIPSLQLTTDRSGPIGSLVLLVQVLHLVHLLGTAQGFDPGMPKIPTFGRRIYHLRLLSNSRPPVLPRGLDRGGAIAIIRKSRWSSLGSMGMKELGYWKHAYKAYIRRLECTPFGAVIFDYDGTLCDPKERYSGPPNEIIKELVRLLKGGIFIGIATGRGSSVRTDLQCLIGKKYWERILIGYYNGGDIALLSKGNHPDKTSPIHPSLQSIKNSLDNHQQFQRLCKYGCRPKQITIEPLNPALWKITRSILLDIVAKRRIPGIKVLESGHSIDVIAPGVSKLDLVTTCEQDAKQIGSPGVALCIGDKGKWPGNDYELLSTPYSISVDTVSTDPSSCWNLSEPGHRGVQATLGYLKCIEVSNGALGFGRKTKVKS